MLLYGNDRVIIHSELPDKGERGKIKTYRIEDC